MADKIKGSCGSESIIGRPLINYINVIPLINYINVINKAYILITMITAIILKLYLAIEFFETICNERLQISVNMVINSNLFIAYMNIFEAYEFIVHLLRTS